MNKKTKIYIYRFLEVIALLLAVLIYLQNRMGIDAERIAMNQGSFNIQVRGKPQMLRSVPGLFQVPGYPKSCERTASHRTEQPIEANTEAKSSLALPAIEKETTPVPAPVPSVAAVDENAGAQMVQISGNTDLSKAAVIDDRSVDSSSNRRGRMSLLVARGPTGAATVTGDVSHGYRSQLARGLLYGAQYQYMICTNCSIGFGMFTNSTSFFSLGIDF